MAHGTGHLSHWPIRAQRTWCPSVVWCHREHRQFAGVAHIDLCVNSWKADRLWKCDGGDSCAGLSVFQAMGMLLFQFDSVAEGSPMSWLFQAPSGQETGSNFVISEPTLPPCILIHKSGIYLKENVSGGLPVPTLCLGVSHQHHTQNVLSPLSVLQNRT